MPIHPLTLTPNTLFSARFLAHSQILQLAKGYRGRSKNCQMLARNRVEHGLQHAFRNRKIKARNFRADWLQSIGAGVREVGLNYSRFIHETKQSGVDLNRRILAQLAQTEPLTFRAIAMHVREATVARGSPLPNVDQLTDYGHVCSSIVVSELPKGKLEVQSKARRASVNFY
jgi:large subunit ribosomal protein L20